MAKENKDTAVEVKSNPKYLVASGRAISCLKGLLSEGEEVNASFLSGGETDLKALIERGAVIES